MEVTGIDVLQEEFSDLHRLILTIDEYYNDEIYLLKEAIEELAKKIHILMNK